MDYQVTKWEFSDVKEPERTAFNEGLCTVEISNAKYMDGNAAAPSDCYKYEFQIKCIEDGPSYGATARLNYWLMDTRKNPPELNRNTAGTLTSLGRAIFGDNVGIPAPGDIEGRIVTAQIKFKDKYVRVYQFEPASRDFEVLATRPQYFRDAQPAPEDVQ